MTYEIISAHRRRRTQGDTTEVGKSSGTAIGDHRMIRKLDGFLASTKLTHWVSSMSNARSASAGTSAMRRYAKPGINRCMLRTSLWAPLALAALLAAGCGADEPTTLLSIPTTAPTTFDSTKEYAGEDRGQADDTTPDREDDAKPDMAEGDAVEGDAVDKEAIKDSPPTPTTRVSDGVGEETLGTEQTSDLESVLVPILITEDLLGDVPRIGPERAVTEINDRTELILTPDTSEWVIGQSAHQPAWNDNYQGTIDLMLDGWAVEHHSAENETQVWVTLTMVFTLEGNYTVVAPHPLMSWVPETFRGKGDPVFASRTDNDGTYFAVDAAWVDPSIWAPVKPGERRKVSMQWRFPGDTIHFVIRAEYHDLDYVIYPQDPGVWGDMTNRDAEGRAPRPELPLIPSCYHNCRELGVPMEMAAVSVTPEPGAWNVSIAILPYPAPEQMSNVDIKVWHEHQNTVYFPTRDPWARIAETGGYMLATVKMPLMVAPLYVNVDLPDGTTLLWKTVAPLQDMLFSHPDWAPLFGERWREAEVVTTVDTICWAHWTGKRNPVDVAPDLLYLNEDDSVEITAEMVQWAVRNVCDYGA